MLCRYILGNPTSVRGPGAKVTTAKAISRMNTLTAGTKTYTDADFMTMVGQISKHSNSKHKDRLLTMLKMFLSTNGVLPETILNLIDGSKIEFDKKVFLIYLMKKSKSMTKVTGSAIKEIIFEIFGDVALTPKPFMGSKKK